MIIRIILSLLLSLIFLSCSNTGFNNLAQTYNAPRELIWKGMVRVMSKEYLGFTKVKAKPPTLITKPLYLDKEFGVNKTAYIARARLTGFTRPYAVDVTVKKYLDIVKHPDIFELDMNRASVILEGIRKFIEEERFNFSIKDQFSPY